MNTLQCHLAKVASRQCKNFRGFASTSASRPVDEDNRILSYESAVDYQALGQRLYEREVTSVRYSENREYREQIGTFSSRYETSDLPKPKITVEAPKPLEDPQITEINEFFRKTDEYLKENNPTRKTEQDLDRSISGERISAKFVQSYQNPQKTPQAAHFSPSADHSLRDSKELKLKEHSDGVLKKAIQREVLAKPWITKYGMLPESPFDIFAREVVLQRDYSTAYVKVLWEQLEPTERYSYEKAYTFAVDLKRKSTAEVKNINQTLHEFFVDTANVHVRLQDAFQQLSAGQRCVEIVLKQDIKLEKVPRAILDLVAIIHRFERKDSAAALNALCAVRMEQLRRNIQQS